jgi:hypothetical protein
MEATPAVQHEFLSNTFCDFLGRRHVTSPSKIGSISFAADDVYQPSHLFEYAVRHLAGLGQLEGGHTQLLLGFVRLLLRQKI